MRSAPGALAAPNRLLALSTGLAFGLLILAAWAQAPAGMRLRPVAVGPASVIAYLILSRLTLRRMPRPPLVQPDSPVTLLMAGTLPLILIACAGATFIWPGHDYTLATIVGGVLFGVTLTSAWDAKRD